MGVKINAKNLLGIAYCLQEWEMSVRLAALKLDLAC